MLSAGSKRAVNITFEYQKPCNFVKLTGWHIRGSKLRQIGHSNKHTALIISCKKKFFVLTLARQENFYVFWKSI